MNDKNKTKQQLIKELATLRRQITKPGKPAAGKKQKSRESGRSVLNPIVLFRDITEHKKIEETYGLSAGLAHELNSPLAGLFLADIL